MEHKDQSYKEALKVLLSDHPSVWIQSEKWVAFVLHLEKCNFGKCLYRCSHFRCFLKRFQGNKGVTYYKWKYQATTWEQYNGTTGKWSSEPDSDITDEGEPAPANDTVLMDWLLADEAWNFIIMQNGAYQSPYEDQSSFGKKEKMDK